MITATLQDWFLSQTRRGGDELPYVFPKVSRTDLPKLTKDLWFTQGAEIGVWRGAFSAAFCEGNPNLHMLCVDPWKSYPEWGDTKNSTADPEAFMEQAYRDAMKRLARLNATIVRQFSVDAAKTVPDGSLDFVYIDGNHGFNSVLSDLKAWAPKVRAGGFVAGHDYGEFSHKPFVQVVAAVKAYTKAHEIDPWFVLAAEKHPSFMWVVR